jgi:hypothetical protein
MMVHHFHFNLCAAFCFALKSKIIHRLFSSLCCSQKKKFQKMAPNQQAPPPADAPPATQPPPPAQDCGPGAGRNYCTPKMSYCNF